MARGQVQGPCLAARLGLSWSAVVWSCLCALCACAWAWACKWVDGKTMAFAPEPGPCTPIIQTVRQTPARPTLTFTHFPWQPLQQWQHINTMPIHPARDFLPAPATSAAGIILAASSSGPRPVVLFLVLAATPRRLVGGFGAGGRRTSPRCSSPTARPALLPSSTLGLHTFFPLSFCVGHSCPDILAA